MTRDESLVSEAALAAYDAASARLFGRPVLEATAAPTEAGQEPLPWRSGPPGQMTAAEYDDEAGVSFGRFSGEDALRAQRRVAEAARQLAKEREVLERAQRLGWETALVATPAADRAVAESVRARAAGGSLSASPAGLQESVAGRRRGTLREVLGWDPSRVRDGR